MLFFRGCIQRGRAKVVLQDTDEYQCIQRKFEIAGLLARGEADIQAGRLVPADEVRKEINSFLDDLESKDEIAACHDK